MSPTEYMVHAVWSIKKETFLNSKYEIESEKFKTTLPNVQYSIALQHDDDAKGNTLIFFDESINATIKEMKLFITSANFQENFSTDGEISLGDILWKKDDKDFTFIVGKGDIKAHKFIIRQFSSVFCAAIDSNKNEFQIEDFNGTIVDAAVRLCYELDVPFNKNYYFKLIEFASTYDMPLIKEQVEYKFKEHITAKNVCEFANKSIELKAEILRGLCVNFLSNCIKTGKPFDGTFSNLHPEIKSLVFKNSFCHTQTS
uniref:BTB domain-containing protein n=1 Tax=Panagrolaimus sp. ES5 TaxID=591445 RepID=A0AC34GP08_9BILA